MKNIGLILIAIILITSCKSEIEETKKKLKNFKVPVETSILELVKFQHIMTVSGNVEAVNDAFISPEMNGQIKQIYVNEGDRVQKGQILAILNTEVTQKSIEELKTGLELATTLYEKQKDLWDQKIGSEIQFLQAKNNKEQLEKKLETLNAQLKMSTITAPFAGIVDDIMQKEGELGTPGRQIMQIVNLSKLKIKADVSEVYLPKINKGDTVIVEFPAYPDIEMKIPISRIGNVIKSGNRTFELELKLNNISEKLKPNIISILHINDYSDDSAIVVPSIIVKKDMKGEFLFIVKKIDNKTVAKKVYVKSGMSYIDKTEILEGLKPNQKIIIEGYNLVSNNSEIEIK